MFAEKKKIVLKGKRKKRFQTGSRGPLPKILNVTLLKFFESSTEISRRMGVQGDGEIQRGRTGKKRGKDDINLAEMGKNFYQLSPSNALQK